jgi:predicted patatin/cPLA2 family phospholipase
MPHPSPTYAGFRWLLAAGSGAILMLHCGCVALIRTVPVPEEKVTQAAVPGYGQIRYGYDQTESDFIADYQSAMRAAPARPEGVSVLALSGGGADGAFCAGVLCGWTESGRRPEFQVVTGVSTGALAAPFAFLGPAFDERLVRAYTTINDPDVFVPRFVRTAFNLLRTDSMADTAPLARTLAGLVDRPMIDAIAAEHRRGRRLYVCTTELVSGRAVFWNLSAIAASGQPDARSLILKILVASASIPIVFPPQYFEVEVGPNRYTEMHVDGGLSRQVFVHLTGARAALPSEPAVPPVPLHAYIIRNAKLIPSYAPIRPSLLPISQRTVETLINAEATGDLHRIYAQTVREESTFRLAAIPDEFPMQHSGVFNAEFMQRLFTLGREQARSGFPWLEQPPQFSVAR